jgi:integrase
MPLCAARGRVSVMDSAQKVTGKPAGARPNREGKPWRRKDGRWQARAYPPGGGIDTRPRYVYGKTRREAMDKRADLEATLAQGLPEDPHQTVADAFARWLGTTLPQYVRAGRMAVTTMDSYRDNARLHIVAPRGGIGHIKLTELRADTVRDWQDRLGRKLSGRQPRTGPKRALSPRTVAYCREILHKMIADAIRDETAGLTRNVVDLVDPPKAEPAEPVILAPAEVSALLVAMAEDRWWCYWLVAFLLGFRRGEGLGMRWTDLDLDRRIWTPGLQVQRQRGEADLATGKRGRGRLVARELKTRASRERVALPVSAVEALTRWQREQRKTRMAAPAWADLELVFTTNLGTAVEPRNMNRQWEKVRARAGISRPARLHDLRHACASYALNEGADLETVRGMLRHSRISTTAVYVHALEDVPRRGADVMDRVLEGLRRG